MKINDFSFRKTLFAIFFFLALFAVGGLVLSYLAVTDSGNTKNLPVISQSSDHTQGQYKKDELIVKFKADLAEEKAEDILLEHGLSTKERFRYTGGRSAKLLGDRDVDETIKSLKNDPNVLYAVPNYIHHPLTTPDDYYFDLQWGLHNIGQEICSINGENDNDTDAPEAWKTTTGNQKVVIAVIDTGIDRNHEDLAANMWTNKAEANGILGVDDDDNGYIDDIYGLDAFADDLDPMDENGHGTHVAGIIGAIGNNTIGVSGVNWTAKIMALRFMGVEGGSDADALECINYIIGINKKGGNVRVINVSWGGGGENPVVGDAIATLKSENILFMAAAGNNGTNNDFTPHYPSSYAMDNIIAVAGTDNRGNKAASSSYGAKSVDVGAPGENIASTYPENKYSYMSGTSMATPFVSGLAALLWSHWGNIPYQDIRDIILASIDPLPSLKGITVTGGRINASTALGLDNIPDLPKAGSLNPEK